MAHQIANWLHKLPLTVRLYAGFSLITVIAMLLLVNFLRNAPVLNEINTHAAATTDQLRRLIALRDAYAEAEEWLVNYELGLDITDGFVYQGRMENLYQQMDALQMSASPEERASLAVIQSQIDKHRQLFPPLQKAMMAQDFARMVQLHEEVLQTTQVIDTELNRLIKVRMTQLDAFRQARDAYYASQRQLFFISLGLALSGCAVAALVQTLSLNAPLNVLAAAAHSLERARPHLSAVQKLSRRGEMLGEAAGEFLELADANSKRRAELQRETEEIRKKIRL